MACLQTRLLPAVCAMIALAALLAVAGGAAAGDSRPPRNAPAGDLGKYAGQWHAILAQFGRLRSRCSGTAIAAIRLLPNGALEAIDVCRSSDGLPRHSRSVIQPAPPAERAKLNLSRALLSSAPVTGTGYYVIDLAPDYSYIVVGEASRNFLWILARSPQIDAAALRRLLQRAAAHGDPHAGAIRKVSARQT